MKAQAGEFFGYGKKAVWARVLMTEEAVVIVKDQAAAVTVGDIRGKKGP